MPKIVKNGLEYSGTPLEEVTAWPPTGDSVQIEQPLMGNTDISEVGDGTVTGAIAQNTEDITELNNGLTQFITYRDVQKNVTIPASGIIYDQSLDIPTISGYKAFAIGGWYSQGGGYADSPFTRLSLKETAQQIEYAMMTRSTSQVTLTIRIKVLYIRSNWVNIPV